MSAVTYVGHATLLVELGEVRVLTDPVLRRGIGHIWRRPPLPAIESLLTTLAGKVEVGRLHIADVGLLDCRCLGECRNRLDQAGSDDRGRNRKNEWVFHVATPCLSGTGASRRDPSTNPENRFV